MGQLILSLPDPYTKAQDSGGKNGQVNFIFPPLMMKASGSSELHATHTAVGREQKGHGYPEESALHSKPGTKHSFGQMAIMVRKHAFYSNSLHTFQHEHRAAGLPFFEKECPYLRSQGQIPSWRGTGSPCELSRCDLDAFTALKLQCKSDDLISLQPVINAIYKIQLIRSKLILFMPSGWYSDGSLCPRV